MKTKQDNRSPFSLDLLFTNDTLLGPSAHVVVRFCSKDEDGTTYLTPDCATAEEFLYQMDRLKSELEIIRNHGVRGFIEAINDYKRKRNSK